MVPVVSGQKTLTHIIGALNKVGVLKKLYALKVNTLCVLSTRTNTETFLHETAFFIHELHMNGRLSIGTDRLVRQIYGNDMAREKKNRYRDKKEGEK